MIGVPTVERPEHGDEDEHSLFDEGPESEAALHPATVFKVAVSSQSPIKQRVFEPQDHVFGYLSCKNCHNDQAFYIHRADVEAGYRFRCRVCRMEITVTVESLAQS
jgi:ribosomal protein S27E